MAVDDDTGRHRLAVTSRRDGADVAVLHLGQDEYRAEAKVRIILGREVIGDVEAEAAGHGQAAAEPQVGDVAHLVARKACVLGGRDAAGGVLFQCAEHDAGQFEKGLLPPLAGDAVGLRDGQDEVFHPAERLLRHLLPALEPGAEGAVGRQSAQRQRRKRHLVHRPRAQGLPLFQQGVQRLTAQLVDGTARHEPGAAIHLHVDLLGRERRAAGLAQAAAQALGGVGAGGLRFGVAVGEGFVGAVSDGQLLAALFDFNFHLHRHPGTLPAVQLPQGRQGLPGQLGVGLAADTEHRAVDLSVQIAGGEAGAAEGILQQVAVIGAALAACQTGADGSSDILRRPQTAFDFRRCYADGLQLVQLVDDGVVLEGQVVQTARLALGQSVGLEGQAAGAGAGAAVAAPSAQESRHIALAADAHAECAVDEALRLDAAVPGDVLHLGQAQLTGQHDPGKAQLFQFQCALQGVDAHLGGTVAGQLGRDVPDELRHREVLTDDGVGPAGGDGPHGVGQTRQLAAVDGGIQRHMDGHAPGMAEPDGFFQAVGIKIARTGAGVEAGKPQIYCVRAAEYCCAEHFFTAHRGKDLNF